MSTKTSLLKRIAQTAVVALLGGLFATLVAPSANAASNASISGTCVARAGHGGVLNISVNGDDDQEVYAVQSAATLSAESATSSVSLDARILSTQPDSGSTSVGLLLGSDTVTSKYATISYLVWLDNENNGTDTSLPDITGNGDPSATVVCTVAKAPASFTLSASSASVAATESATFTITPRDAAGNATLLAANEDIVVQSSLTTALATSGQYITDADGNRTGAVVDGGNMPRLEAGSAAAIALDNENLNGENTCTIGSSTARCTLTLNDENANGVHAGESDSPNLTADSDTITATGAFTVNVTNTTAATTTWTVRGAGTIGMLSATASTFTLTTLAYSYGVCYGVGSVAAVGTAGSTAAVGGGIIDGNQVAPANNPDATGTAATCRTNGAAGPATASDSYTVSTEKKSVTIKWGLNAAGTLPVTIAAVSTTSSTPAGITLETVNLASGVDTFVSLTLTATAPVAGQSYKVTWNAAQGSARTLTFTYAEPRVDASNGNVVLTPAGGRALNGATMNITATVRDQFRSLVNGATVLFTVTGRNATTSAVAATTNSSGVASYSFTDDQTPAATLSDSVSATARTSGAATSATATAVAFTWTASLTVTTLRLTNNADSAGVAIDTDVTFTATATGASGEALSGYPITFTADSKSYESTTGAASFVAYTGTNGVATATFDGRLVGTSTITATSGGKTATSSYDVLAGSARTISVDAAAASMAAGQSKRVTATVKDRYGNGIEDATVTVSYSGTAGRVASVNGIAASTATANADGRVVIEISSDAATGAGTGTLTVKFTGGNTSTAATNADGSAQPARVASATTAVTITAADSSTKDAAEAASDAALEAIDAANAATDAANLAAEAADAATVAAEEARDAADAATAAVEALASEVATLIAGLKAQITTLANTVAKIAKKVRA